MFAGKPLPIAPGTNPGGPTAGRSSSVGLPGRAVLGTAGAVVVVPGLPGLVVVGLAGTVVVVLVVVVLVVDVVEVVVVVLVVVDVVVVGGSVVDVVTSMTGGATSRTLTIDGTGNTTVSGTVANGSTSTAGALTNVRPSAGFIQSVAVVSRVDATLGEIIVSLDEAGTLYTEVLERAISDEATNLTTGTAKLTFRMPFGFTLTGIRASVNTAPVGAALQVDVNLTGTGSIFSTPLTIDDGEKTSVTAATPAVISTTTLADDAEITVDIDQVGSTTAGKGLKLVMLGYRT